jgi:hypothetical protein
MFTVFTVCSLYADVTLGVQLLVCPVAATAMEQMDDSVGQILQKLSDTGLDKNTVVVWTSDNGAWL